MRNWRDIAYLEQGSTRQQLAFEYLRKYSVLEALAAYDPALVSTVCVGLDIPGSDLDIICHVRDPVAFIHDCHGAFGERLGFHFHLRRENPFEAVVRFVLRSFPVEIFASVLPIEVQAAWRHLSVMDRLLTLGGEPLRHYLRTLKSSGLKTEPAIAHALNLAGEPYAAVMSLEMLDDERLTTLLPKLSEIGEPVQPPSS